MALTRPDHRAGELATLATYLTGTETRVETVRVRIRVAVARGSAGDLAAGHESTFDE